MGGESTREWKEKEGDMSGMFHLRARAPAVINQLSTSHSSCKVEPTRNLWIFKHVGAEVSVPRLKFVEAVVARNER